VCESEYFVEHAKLSVIRKVAKNNPHPALTFILDTVDEIWDREIQKLIDEAKLKKVAFVTKF